MAAHQPADVRWARVQAHAAGQSAAHLPSMRRRAQSAAAGVLLLASALALVRLRKTGGAGRAGALQLTYATPGAAVGQPAGWMVQARALPASPTMWRAASAVANARAAIGTATLRRAFPSWPGIRAAPVMPSYHGPVEYGGAPISATVAPRSPGPLLGSPIAAYHVAIPASAPAGVMPGASALVPAQASLPAQYSGGPFWGGMPHIVGPVSAPGMVAAYGAIPAYAGREFPVTPVTTPQDLAVNAAIHAGANAAAGAGLQPLAMQAPAGYAVPAPDFLPTVSVKARAPVQTVTPVAAGPPQAAVVAGGAEQMKIVAGPGKGKIVDVTAAGKIVGEGTAPAVATKAAVHVHAVASPAALHVAPSMPEMPGMPVINGFGPMAVPLAHTVVETPSLRPRDVLSGTEQAALSADSASQAAATAQSALDSNSIGKSDAVKGAPAGDIAGRASAESSETAGRVGEEVTGKEAKIDASKVEGADAVPADAAEGDAAQVVKGRNGASLVGTRVVQLHSTDGDLAASGHLRQGKGGKVASGSRRGNADASGDASGLLRRQARLGDEPRVLVSVPRGKRAGDFFSAEVAGRGLMLVEVPQGVRSGDQLQLLQVPADDGEELEWVKYNPTQNRAGGGLASWWSAGDLSARHRGPDQDAMDNAAKSRHEIRDAWNLGDIAPRSYFH